jgi:hypothetical protein
VARRLWPEDQYLPQVRDAGMNCEERRRMLRTAFPENARLDISENLLITGVISDDITVFFITYPRS